ncbi:hypothetical protein [Leucobacter ruminantium]|uniref:Tetracyclin repressor-like C-terminal group 31 domain-containing protein n=1 Tax=Leucobacter ruminantium TaxID=1289170 RepID=A0A939LXG5_9MICO|nr:hypothetical protein [Leucobacter ruminantium]MBO1806569.1 hypothetical protein [Leucobacter ruminantium]
MIEVQSGPLAARTRARYALFLEADERAARPLHKQRAGMEAWLCTILKNLGGEKAEARAPFLMAAAEGVLLHRITINPEAPIEESVALAVDATLAQA